MTKEETSFAFMDKVVDDPWLSCNTVFTNVFIKLICAGLVSAECSWHLVVNIPGVIYQVPPGIIAIIFVRYCNIHVVSTWIDLFETHGKLDDLGELKVCTSESFGTKGWLCRQVQRVGCVPRYRGLVVSPGTESWLCRQVQRVGCVARYRGLFM